jgi:hypothetical protein
MRVAWIFFLGSAVFLASAHLNSQQTSTAVQRDAQALAIVQQSVRAMASSAPADSSATGSVTIVEGSTTQSGTIQILTLGASQTSEILILPDGTRTVVYSNGLAKETNGTQAAAPPLETVVTDQCSDFPLPLLLSALNNPDTSMRYVGPETLDGTAVQHIQVWNSFASKPRLQKVASFSLRDIWFDSSSALPLKIAHTRREGGGAAPSIPVEISFANYTKVAGVLYPFQITKSFNGTPWQTITIQNVSFNTGLTAAQFQVE